MPTRRTIFLGLAAVGVGGLVLSGKSDNVLRAIGVSPVPEVRDSDIALVKTAIAESNDLLAAAIQVKANFAASVLSTQIAELGGTATRKTEHPTITAKGILKVACEQAAIQRRDDAVAAVAPQLAQTLASLAAGLAQLSVTPSEAL